MDVLKFYKVNGKMAFTYDEAYLIVTDTLHCKYKKESSGYGYVCDGSVFIEQYEGRYGKGYKILKDSFYDSKRKKFFHKVQYFIED